MQKIVKTLQRNLEHHLNQLTPNHEIKNCYKYAVLPPGKLFRPLIAWAIASDISKKEIDLNPTSNHSYLCSALELHHTYTLIHDDLPCMDNDDFRRGRPSLHKAFGEWRALLAGDGLLNASYQLLANIDSPNLSRLLKFSTRALGPKGLIQGQVLDLSEDMKRNLYLLMETHKLKTARLIQVAIINSLLLICPTPSFRMFIDLYRLGHVIGMLFQYLDDLTELAESSISVHEKSINPWPTQGEIVFHELQKHFVAYKKITLKYHLNYFSQIISNYLEKTNQQLKHNSTNIQKHLSSLQLAPITLLLDDSNILK